MVEYSSLQPLPYGEKREMCKLVDTMANTKIIVRNNGSLRIEGSFTIEDGEGNTFDLAGRAVIGLCRCGQSENKPFCDGTHARIGFESAVKACALPPPKAKA